jgi:hypothetical protein
MVLIEASLQPQDKLPIGGELFSVYGAGEPIRVGIESGVGDLWSLTQRYLSPICFVSLSREPT